ncbi:MAG TPA: hypothetical protein VJK52_00830, partial [Candidatus Nanoarchaeia archaeon]|nr:hypothetical protein [Candidatus Nanoarchaeia archaeon]
MSDLTTRLSPEEVALARFRLNCISPNDGKYAQKSSPVFPYLTAQAEWQTCAQVQQALLEVRSRFDSKVVGRHLVEMRLAVERFDPLNAALWEDKLHHDQLAVL